MESYLELYSLLQYILKFFKIFASKLCHFYFPSSKTPIRRKYASKFDSIVHFSSTEELLRIVKQVVGLSDYKVQQLNGITMVRILQSYYYKLSPIKNMDNQQYLEINGLLVDKMKPFQVFQVFPGALSRCSGPGKACKNKQDSNLKAFAKCLFEQDIEDCQEIDQILLHYRSVSSLRDFYLFSPPGFHRFRSEETNEDQPKKTIFANEFTPFDYVRQQA